MVAPDGLAKVQHQQRFWCENNSGIPFLLSCLFALVFGAKPALGSLLLLPPYVRMYVWTCADVLLFSPDDEVMPALKLNQHSLTNKGQAPGKGKTREAEDNCQSERVKRKRKRVLISLCTATSACAPKCECVNALLLMRC